MIEPDSSEIQMVGLDIPHHADSAFDHVCQQLNRLTMLLGLQDVKDQVFLAYDAICNRSLGFPLGKRPPWFSRINADGTPFQYSATLGAPFRSLQFLGEAGWPNAPGTERIRASHECINYVARIFNADNELKTVEDLISTLTPAKDPQLATDPAGAFWIGAAFAHDRKPQLRIYLNGNWGCEDDRWAQLRHLASHFGLLNAWINAENILKRETKPLGCAFTISQGAKVSGRIYVSSYGKLLDYYEELARAVSGDQFANNMLQYAECLLGLDSVYPTPTAVCSLGLVEGGSLDFKFELCTHCLFKNDVEASDRLNKCFALAGINAIDYQQLLEIISDGRLNDRSLQLHCYSGVGVKQGVEYYSVYLKPKLIEV